MELENNYSLLQDNTISILKNYPRFLTLLKVIANRLDSLQNCANYMCENTRLETAEGIWLDYLAWLVGTTRETFDITQFFCVNVAHLNVSKLFYFEGISSTSKGNLQDLYLRKRIRGKIAYNTSRATRNENIKIMQNIFNADKVVISVAEPMLLDITLYGDDIIYPSIASLRDTITNIIGCGVGLRNLDIQPSNTI